ncbi:type II toxin-antitoxin system HicB family antitoxin [candidate division WOR-3 bacterium]|nr:type II toxin-antitoxin system HicB family antitoxin [candidate division WOR-3 bacterium]
MQKIIAYIEKDPKNKLYVAIVPGIPGIHTQAKTQGCTEMRLKIWEFTEIGLLKEANIIQNCNKPQHKILM